MESHWIKPGMNVRIKNLPNAQDYIRLFPGSVLGTQFVTEMLEFRGEIAEVAEVIDRKIFGFNPILLKYHRFYWIEPWLQPVNKSIKLSDLV